MKKITSPDGAAISTTYSLNSTTTKDPALVSREATSDALGRLVQVIENPGTSSQMTSYDYDAAGNLTLVCHGVEIKDHACATGVVEQRSYTYDWLSRLKSATNPETASLATNYNSYDGNGNLLTKTDPNNVMVSYTYDNWNRISKKTYSCKDNVSCPSAPNDELGRVSGTKQTVDSKAYSFGYDYGLAGLTRERYPSERIVSFEHDGAGRIKTVWNGEVDLGTKYTSSIAYASHGGITSLQFGTDSPPLDNGLYEQTCYNSRLHTTGVRVGTVAPAATCASQAGDLLVLGFGYGTDPTKNSGNLRSQTITADGHTFSQSYDYDGFNRLERASEGTDPEPMLHVLFDGGPISARSG